MNRTLPIIVTLALAATAWGQAPIVSLQSYPPPADTTAREARRRAPVIGLAQAPGDDVPPPAPVVSHAGQPLPMSESPVVDGGGLYTAGGCAGGCVGVCQGDCLGDGLVGGACPSGGVCPPNCPCLKCFPKRMWFTAAYQFTFAKSRSVPPLVTTSPDGTPRNLAGVLPGATVLFGGDSVGGDLSSGLRLEMGRWLGDGHVGFGGRFFFMESDADDFAASADGTSPILALPYFDPVSAMEDAVLLSHPDVAENGSVGISYDLETTSAEALMRFKLARGRGVHVDLTGGYHFARVDDALRLQAQATDIDNTNLVPNGTVFDITDSFAAKNTFHGGSIGLNLKLCHGRVVVRGMSKLSVGNMHQQLSIAGRQVATLPPNLGGGQSVANNGVYAQQSLIGSYDRDRTSFVPEASLQLGYRVSRCLELNIGYSMLYFTNVALAGDAIDHTVDLDGPAGPPVNFTDTSLWLQGVTVGGAWKF